jgi:nucleotidyltransferase/DNA polymerase involved in DNA repair
LFEFIMRKIIHVDMDAFYASTNRSKEKPFRTLGWPGVVKGPFVHAGGPEL